jgi:hypothetical protein
MEFIRPAEENREIVIVELTLAGPLYTVFLKVCQIVHEAKKTHPETAPDPGPPPATLCLLGMDFIMTLFFINVHFFASLKSTSCCLSMHYSCRQTKVNEKIPRNLS